MTTELQKVKQQLVELKSLTSLTAQRKLNQRLNVERRATRVKHAACVRVLDRYLNGQLALDATTKKMIERAVKL